MVRANLVGLYPSIPHKAGLNALREALGNRKNKCIPTDNLLKMVKFCFKGNYFEFNGKLESDVLKSRELTPFNWYFSTDNVFFIWTHGDEKHASLSNVLSNYHPSIKFTHESNKEHTIHF